MYDDFEDDDCVVSDVVLNGQVDPVVYDDHAVFEVLFSFNGDDYITTLIVRNNSIKANPCAQSMYDDSTITLSTVDCDKIVYQIKQSEYAMDSINSYAK